MPLEYNDSGIKTLTAGLNLVQRFYGPLVAAASLDFTGLDGRELRAQWRHAAGVDLRVAWFEEFAVDVAAGESGVITPTVASFYMAQLEVELISGEPGDLPWEVRSL